MLNINNLNTITIREVRDIALALGIDPGVMGRSQLTAAILAKEKEIQGLRVECAKLGLATEGNEADLRIRLAQAEPGTITEADRRLYITTAKVFLGLGIAALVVSIPHLTGELARLTGLNLFMAFALAVVVDGAIMACKMAEVLSRKFNLGTVKWVTLTLMVAALGFSGAVNASGFCHHGSGGVLGLAMSVLFAGIIAGTTFGSFQTAAFLFTVQERRDRAKEQADREAKRAKADPAAKLRAAADSLDHIIQVASKLK